MLMAKKISDLNYWEDRFLQIEIDRDKLDRRYIKSMDKRYSKLANKIQSEINEWIDKYAVNDEISRESAEILLSKAEQKSWSMSLSEFRRKAIDGNYTQELNREYYRSRITRLQQLERQIYFELAEFANDEIGELGYHLENQLEETYLRNIYELSDQGSIPLSFETYSKEALKQAVYASWKGKNFSERVWKNHLKDIPKKLSATLAEGIAKGWGTDKIVKQMMVGIDDNLRNRMITLVQTESANIAEQGAQKSYKETGVKQYEWMATLEIHTCEQCGNLDGQIFTVGSKDALQPIVDTHPNCRCTTVPVIKGFRHLHRWYRDPVTGKGKRGEYVIFNDWAEEFKAA